jgi:hypothetical protein
MIAIRLGAAAVYRRDTYRAGRATPSVAMRFAYQDNQHCEMYHNAILRLGAGRVALICAVPPERRAPSELCR